MARIRITISTEQDIAEAILNSLFQLWKEFPESIPGRKKKELRYAMLHILHDINMEVADRARLVPIATAIDYAGWVQAGGVNDRSRSAQPEPHRFVD